MKKGKLLGVLMAMAVGLQVSSPVTFAETNSETDPFIRGVDVSTLDMLEKLGAHYYENGKEGDALGILHNNGANYVRLKIWVDPYDKDGNPYGGGNNDFETTLSLAKRAKEQGMGILIDFHLSDFGQIRQTR